MAEKNINGWLWAGALATVIIFLWVLSDFDLWYDETGLPGVVLVGALSFVLLTVLLKYGYRRWV